MIEIDVVSKVSRFLQENDTKAIFIKDSIPGKMHYESLYRRHASELLFQPNRVYQVYLPFDLTDRIITANPNTGTVSSIDEMRSSLMNLIGSQVFIQKVEPDKGRNAFDRNSNAEAARYLNLESVDLWQGVMFYFFM